MTDKRLGRSETGEPEVAPPVKEPAPVGTADASGQAISATEAPRESVDMQAFIGRQLRAVFDDVAKQPIPDRFIELMQQLERKTAQG